MSEPQVTGGGDCLPGKNRAWRETAEGPAHQLQKQEEAIVGTLGTYVWGNAKKKNALLEVFGICWMTACRGSSSRRSTAPTRTSLPSPTTSRTVVSGFSSTLLVGFSILNWRWAVWGNPQASLFSRQFMAEAYELLSAQRI